VREPDPDGLWGPFALAQVYEDQRLYRQVVEALAPVVTTWKPSDTTPARQGLLVLTHLGFAQMQLGDNAGAITTFELARRYAGGDPSYETYLAQAYLGARRYDDALKVIGPLRSRRPQDARLAQLQARVLSAAGRRDQAVAVLQDSVKKNPEIPSAWLSLADTLSESSRTDEAFKVLDDASSRFPDDVAVPFQRGALYERAKDYAKAERAFRDVIAKDPLHAPALNFLGYMFAERGERLDEAVALIQRALTVDPGNGSYLDSLGWALFKQRKLAQAQESLARAAEQLPGNSVVQDHFADVLAALGRNGDAVAAWERALAGDMESLDRAVLERKIRQARERVQR
jgi:tetratricopeptide (TPR) repeat protein